MCGASMSRALQRRRMMADYRFCLEGLESRHLLSVLPIEAVPVGGDPLSPSPTSLVVTFSQSALRYPWINGDIQLDRIGNDGTTTQLFVNTPRPPSDPSLIPMPTATLNKSGTQVTATIPLNQTFPAGSYSIVLARKTPLSYILSGATNPFFYTVGNGSWDWTSDQTITEFTVAPAVVPKGVTFNEAIDLGTIGSQVTTSSGSLDPAAAQTYALYKVTLSPGHFWRLGVELDAQRIGSSLLGALTLFDQQGNVLATRDTGTGVPSSPADPYFFTGLNPGVYYIGVSGAGNLAGQPGGYDPVTGTIGSAGQAQAGGAYDLQVVADPADSLTQVVGFSLQRADTLNPTPTGLTLTFSGPIDPNSLMSNSPVLVCDASGKAWPTTLSSYDGSQCQVSFVFDQPPPPGQYTVVVPPSGGLADLTGRAPVSPGQNPGVLATFTVDPQTSQPVAGDLGVLWPNSQIQVSQFATIPPGQEFVSRVVVPVTGLYTLETTFTQGSVAILRAGPDGVASIDPASTSNTYEMPLEAGVYLVSFRTVGTQPAVGQWTFKSAGIDHESIVDNGVGQGPALSLRLVDPISPSLPSDPPSVPTPVPVEPVVLPSSPQSGSNTVPIAAPVGSGEAVAATGVSVIPASLVVTVSTGLLGTPALQNEPVAVVGPVVAG